MKFLSIILVCLTGRAVAQTALANDYQISGTVVDHLTNRPLNHVLVQITQTGKAGAEASALTQADGNFLFLHVPKGKYQLQAEKRGRMFEAFHSEAGYSTAIVVDGKQKTDGIIFAMKTDASINGTVMGDDGEPVRGAQVTLFKEGVNNGEAQTMHAGGSATNSEGHFHLGHLVPGKYYLATQATPWFSSPSVEMVFPVTFYGDTTDGSAARPIMLTEGGTADAQIIMRAVPSIHVKLASGTRGVGLFVAGPGGTRIPSSASYRGVGPHFAGKGGRVSMRPAPNVVSSRGVEEGQAEMANLAAGRYEVVAFGDKGAAGQSHTVELANGSVLSLDEPSSSTVTGTVLFDGPKPGGDLDVFLTGTKSGGAMSLVAADGTFKFDKVAPGTYSIHFNSPSLTATSVMAKNARILGEGLEVTSGASPELTIRVTATETLAKVEGIAVRDGNPVPGAMVLLLPQDLGRTLLIRRDQSDSDGSFSLNGVLPGKYTLVAIDDGAEVAYKSEAVIKPYLEGGTKLMVPSESSETINVPVQSRKP